MKEVPSKTLSLGPNATIVLERIKRSVDIEPPMTLPGTTQLSNAWVEWQIRHTGMPREVAIGKGYMILDSSKSANFLVGDDLTATNDEGLSILGVSRINNYFGIATGLLYRTLNTRRAQNRR